MDGGEHYATTTDRITRRLEAYEDRTALAMVLLAVAYLGIFSLQVLVFPIAQPWDSILRVSGNSIWLIFVLDLAFHTYLAPQRWMYLAKHPIDVLAALVPAFRSLRVLRVFTAGQWLVQRGARLAIGRTGAAIGAAVAFLAVYDAERGVDGVDGANINSFGDAFWWAFVTMTTVGYGDVFPVTLEGRLVGVAVMVGGVSLIGLVSATLASGFLAHIQGQTNSDTALILKKLETVEAQLSALVEAKSPVEVSVEGLKPTIPPAATRRGLGCVIELRRMRCGSPCA